MNHYRSAIAICLAAGTLLAGTWSEATGQVIDHPNASAPFEQRFDWAVENAAVAGGGKAWIGFEIVRRMSKGGSFVSSDGWSFHGTSRNHRWMTLYELIEGRPPAKAASSSDEDKVRMAARYVLEDLGWPVPEEEMDYRRVGVLLGIDTTKPLSDRWDIVWLGNVEMEFNRRGRPLLWLGAAEASESVPVLRSLLRPELSEDGRERLVNAIGIHSESEIVVPVLIAVLRNDPRFEVREEAVEALADHRSAEALDALIWSARNDAHEEVREEGVSALARFNDDRATDALIDRATNDLHREVRDEAVEALGRRRSDKALDALTKIALEDSRRDIQEEAVEAIGRYPEHQRLPVLASIVRDHPSAGVREEVVEQLRMSSSAEAAMILAGVAKKDPSGSVQEEAIEALFTLGAEAGVDALAEIARSHPSYELRVEALELLESLRGPRATKAAETLRKEMSP